MRCPRLSHKLVCITAALLLVASARDAHGTTSKREPFIVGTVSAIESTHLGDTRRVYVYTPADYNASDRRYPTLYVLDGHIYFHHAVGYAKVFSQFEKTPDFIVVGIESQRPQRFAHFSSREDDYRAFLRDEVFPYVDQTFRTTDERILFGWEYAGGFVLRWLADRIGGVDGFVAASPFPVEQEMVDRIGKGATEASTSIFLAFGDDEGADEPAVRNLVTWLETGGAARPNGHYERLLGEHHNTTPHRALHHGLLHHYNDYAWLHYSSLEDFDTRGGLAATRTYYEHRGTKYGLPTAVHRQTMHNLALLAYRANDVERFVQFLDAFDGFIARTNRGWCQTFATFLLGNAHAERALTVLDTALARFDETASLHALRAEALEATGNQDAARGAWQRAVDLAESAEDEHLTTYRDRLRALDSQR